MGLIDQVFSSFFHQDGFRPKIKKSQHFQHWVSVPSLTRCLFCEEIHGKIWRLAEEPNPKPPAHPYCHCRIETMKSIEAGTATKNGLDGVDWYLKHNWGLPDYYISYEEALKSKWDRGKWLSNFFPNRMLSMGLYENRNKHLPEKLGRKWYEADINYQTGRRNAQRIVYSNDGLIFVTYDHYQTFYEII